MEIVIQNVNVAVVNLRVCPLDNIVVHFVCFSALSGKRKQLFNQLSVIERECDAVTQIQ